MVSASGPTEGPAVCHSLVLATSLPAASALPTCLALADSGPDHAVRAGQGTCAVDLAPACVVPLRGRNSGHG